MGAGSSSRENDITPELFRALKSEYERLKEENADEATIIEALQSAAAAHAKAAQNHSGRAADFELGDVVLVKAMGSYLQFEGVVLDIESPSDGGSYTYTVRYSTGEDDDEAEVEMEVRPTRMRKVMLWSSFEIGDVVKAKSQGSTMKFEGSVVDILPDGHLLVDFGDDSDAEVVRAEDACKVASRRICPARRWQAAFSGIKLELKGVKGFMSSVSESKT